MVVWPGQLDVAQAWHLEAVAVTLILSLLVATIILLGEGSATSLEVVAAESHKFVGLATEVSTCVTRCATMLLEQLITTQLLGCEGVVVAIQPLVEL